MAPANELEEASGGPEAVRKLRGEGLGGGGREAEVPAEAVEEREGEFVDSGDHEELEEPVGSVALEAVGVEEEVLVGVEAEGLGGEADVGEGGGGGGEELVEDGGVLADEVDGAEGELGGALEEGEGEGLGGFEGDEGFEGV